MEARCFFILFSNNNLSIGELGWEKDMDNDLERDHGTIMLVLRLKVRKENFSVCFFWLAGQYTQYSMRR